MIAMDRQDSIDNALLATMPLQRQQKDMETYLPPLPQSTTSNMDTVWVTKKYISTDGRLTVPAPRHKTMYESNASALTVPDAHWSQPSLSVNPWSWSREHEQTPHYRSQPSTRCEEWSTLRQMLPSRGSSHPRTPPNWGTGYMQPPARSTAMKDNFPHNNSQMTRFVDDMYTTNRLFKLH